MSRVQEILIELAAVGGYIRGMEDTLTEWSGCSPDDSYGDEVDGLVRELSRLVL